MRDQPGQKLLILDLMQERIVRADDGSNNLLAVYNSPRSLEQDNDGTLGLLPYFPKIRVCVFITLLNAG